ncbi:MAG: MFS transporter [Chloroflexi bacterium]|nr:MFS transporter [Chloroflexota bacterium]
MTQSISQQNPMARVMGLRDFRLLFAGATTSLLGDQFSLIATPWLVLQLTHDPMALGTVLALQGIPRALFMLIGGAITDRFSPRKVMLSASIIRFFLTAMMALVVITGTVQIWMIYLFSLAFGIVAGFAIPAENSIVPQLVAEEDLQAGNSIIMGITQLAGFVGPTIAGVLIGNFAGSNTGIFLAFLIDAITFIVSAITLALIHTAKTSTPETREETVWAAILNGIKYLVNDRALRLVFIVLMSINFFLLGPLLVGIPVLASERLAEGAIAYGLLLSAFAGGNLAGILGAGALPRPTTGTMKLILVVFVVAFGLGVASLGFVINTWVDFASMAILGLANGYVSILMFTWMQIQTPKDMLGRMMSLITFSSTGLVPISQALAGLVSKWDLTNMFAIAGGIVVVFGLVLSAHPDLQLLGASIAGTPVEAE